MKTKKGRGLYSQSAGILFACGFFILTGTQCRAVLGVGDVVIIAEDLTDVWKWPREEMRWQKAAMLAQTQIKELERIRATLGSPSSAAAKVVPSVGKVSSALSALASMEEWEAYATGKASSYMPGGRGQVFEEQTKLSGSMDVFGEKQTRDSVRYKAIGQQLALRQREAEAQAQLEKVVEAELAVQKALLSRMASVSTAMDLEALQAAFAASKQRLELARLKVEQVEGQSEMLEARIRLERERKEEGDREWAEKLAEKLKARALTSLHAQKGRSS